LRDACKGFGWKKECLGGLEDIWRGLGCLEDLWRRFRRLQGFWGV